MSQVYSIEAQRAKPVSLGLIPAPRLRLAARKGLLGDFAGLEVTSMVWIGRDNGVDAAACPLGGSVIDDARIRLVHAGVIDCDLFESIGAAIFVSFVASLAASSSSASSSESRAAMRSASSRKLYWLL